MRRKLTILAVLVLVLALAAAGSWAYFTDAGEATNIVRTGTIQIEINEYTLNGDDLRVEYPVEPVTGVMPGAFCSKIVEIGNTGSGEAWLRFRISTTIVSASGEPLPNTFTDSEGNEGQAMVALRLSDTTDPELPFIEKDGWLYMKEPVPAGEVCQVLEGVTFHNEMGNEYQGCGVTIEIKAQAVQTANNPIPEGGDVTDVAGWDA